MSATPDTIIYLVDDAVSIRRGLSRLLAARGYHVRAFEAPEAFLDDLPEEPVGCVLLDLDMPTMSGIEVQRRLADVAARLPIVFVSGRGSVATCAEALKAGAVDFLEKPVDEERLCQAIEQALAQNAAARRTHAAREAARALIDRLTARERDVLRLVVRGFTSPEIGELLGIAPGTVKIHRKHLVAKLEADSLPDLLMLYQQAELE